MITGLHHVAVGVPDLDAAVDFYVEAFGCEVLWKARIEGPSAADGVIGIGDVTAGAAMLRLGENHLELWQYESPEQVDRRSPPNGLGYPHIGVTVVDIHAEHERLTSLGVKFVGAPVDVGYATAVYGQDPFGSIVEILELAPS